MSLPSRTRLSVLLALSIPVGAAAQTPPSAIARQYAAQANQLIDAALADSSAWGRLAFLTDRFGPRPAGSRALEQAIDWVLAEMKADRIFAIGEPVRVPRWIRGDETLELLTAEPVLAAQQLQPAPIDTTQLLNPNDTIQPPPAAPQPVPLHRTRIPMLGLGGSIGTPRWGVTGPVLVVSSFDELEQINVRAKGKVVLFDVPFTTYGETVQYRVKGASAAARQGAVAALIRSVTPFSLRTPHTGRMIYDSTAPRIPAAAITLEDAEMIHRKVASGDSVSVRLTMGARTLPDTTSRNIVAEIRGAEHPEQVVVLGGHIDSWDVGRGAMDDGGGVVAAWQALNLIRKLGLKPRRTIRVVGWTNEENGLSGAAAYMKAHGREEHVLAIEADAGIFAPVGFGLTGSDSARAILRQVAGLLKRVGADSIGPSGGGADIDSLVQQGVPGMGLQMRGDRYFWYHHTDADTVDKIDPRDLNLCAAALAVMAFVVADLPEPLPK